MTSTLQVDLEKVSCTPTEREYWARLLAEGREMKDTLDKLEEAETKIGDQRSKAMADLSKLESALEDKLLAFAMGKPKILQDHREKITDFKSTIIDCNEALAVIEKRKKQAGHHVATARTIELRIRDRIRETEDKEAKKAKA